MCKSALETKRIVCKSALETKRIGSKSARLGPGGNGKRIDSKSGLFFVRNGFGTATREGDDLEKKGKGRTERESDEREEIR